MAISKHEQDMIRALAMSDYRRARLAARAVLAGDNSKKNEWFREKYAPLLEDRDSVPLAERVPSHIRTFVVVEDPSESFIAARHWLSEREAAVVARASTMRTVAHEMKALDVRYVNSTLLYGKSGTGKTELGRRIAYELGLPFVYLNFSTIVQSYMGQTAGNIHAVFDFVRSEPVVFMLDELDCIGLSRKGAAGTGADGELQRVTISLMQEMDRLENDVVLLAATNRLDNIDPALRRRFTAEHEVLPLQNSTEVGALLSIIAKSIQDASADPESEWMMDIAGEVWKRAERADERCQARVVGRLYDALAAELAANPGVHVPAVRDDSDEAGA